MQQKPKIKTLAELKHAGYAPKTVKQEVRNNLIKQIQHNQNSFPGILGYDNTVIPDVERALLSQHNILFLGLRGQAKTRMAREMVHLLDEWIPVIKDSEINEDPFAPLSHFGRAQINEKKDATPIDWLHRSERYGEKLATPDVSVADLIGDIDPIKAAHQKLSFADERALHYGIIPRSHRGIFVINELPDLQARIQVALFNILQEGDIQIRGFKLRMPLDILFIFTANPEDYTNRGSIVTPLKDRIESQIITHYPATREISKAITEQEAQITEAQKKNFIIPELCRLLIEQIAIEARSSEYVDQKSGVSARLTISAYENLYSAVERRALKEGTSTGIARITDFIGIIPSITGKIELVYEGEQEGAGNVAYKLLSQAIRNLFVVYFPAPQSFKTTSKENQNRKSGSNPYQPVIYWFGRGNELLMLQDTSDDAYRQALYQIDGLHAAVEKLKPGLDDSEKLLFMEFLLHGLAAYSLISKKNIDSTGFSFGDILGSMINMDMRDEEIDY